MQYQFSPIIALPALKSIPLDTTKHTPEAANIPYAISGLSSPLINTPIPDNATLTTNNAPDLLSLDPALTLQASCENI
jgi:hypothetical protein